MQLRAATNSGLTLTFGTAVSPSSYQVTNIINQVGVPKIATNASSGVYYGNGASFSVSGTAVSVSNLSYGLVPLFAPPNSASPLQAKYLVDGLQLAVFYVSAGAMTCGLFKGNSSTAGGAISQINLGVSLGFNNNNIFDTDSFFDVIGGNTGIVVGESNNFLTTQVIGVL
jgi:hypothetical protein